MEPLLVFESYNFANLDRSWIKNVWESAFTNIENVPADYLIFLESPDIIELLKETRTVIKNWISQNSVEEESERTESSETPAEVSWQTLVALNLDIQALLAVLAYLMKRGQEFDASQDSRLSCLRSTNLYFVLLSIPGSNAFQAFHPDLYEVALKTLTLSKRLNSSAVKSRKKSHFDALDDDLGLEEAIEPFCSLPKSQNITLTKGLNGVVFDLIMMLKSASTSLDSRSMEITVFNLTEITKLADETMSDFSRVKKSEASTNSLAYNAYVALRFLCNPKYAKIPLITRTIGKYMLPQILVSSNTQLPPRQMATVRESSIHFLKTLLEKHGREAHETLITLIQHSMIKSPDRLEGRQKQAIVVIKLINICQGSETIYKKCLLDLVYFSNHAKISSRIFAQEIIGKYLLDLSSSQNNRHDEENSWSSSRIKKLLLAAALSRCVDSSSMVRGRAIATFAEYTESIASPEMREIFCVNTHRQLTEMPSLENLVDAINDNDVDKILPSFEGIIAMLRGRSEDERALVRRSSLQALRNGILVTPELLDEAMPIIKDHCRDPALTVRRFAIRVFTTLLEKFPDNSSLCKAWVDSVVPRVFDAETKVQEEVLDSLEKLTIQKIAHCKSRRESDLPWRIVDELAINRMGDHLSKACNIWFSRETIMNETVANVKSHIGTKNNVQAWLLLASIAESRPLGNMTDYYSYYEKALKEDSNEDGFLATVVLQVLRHCWPSLGEQSICKIQEDILKYMKEYRVRVPLISHCLDILHGYEIFRALHAPPGSEGESSTMRDLMRLSEATIARLIEPEACENHERDPGTILFRAICTLGHATFLCTEKISLPSLRILQGFLLEWNMLPERVRARRELQAAAVTVLGQQSLRDRDIAQEMTPIFGQLLRNTSQDSKDSNIANGPAVRINTAKVLADICVRFTALVEPYLPDMCISMKDPNPKVRQVILVIFIQMLAEDFIKINGPFFFHILSMLSDSDSTIRQMTIFLVKERLLSKNKSLMTQQFINSLFHFNDYERRTAGNSQRRRCAKEREALTLPGEKGSKERRMIYDFMLEHLEAPGKLKILVGLTRQILKSTCKSRGSGLGGLDISTQKGICVFRDALYVVASENLQPNSCAKQTVDDDNLEETANPTSTTAACLQIVEAMKIHRLRILLPGLVELRERFVDAKSPLVLDVAKLIGSLLSEYSKDQLESLYNEYPKLDKEIERDIRKFNEEENSRMRIKSSTPKKSKIDTSALINPNWMPQIVLRRISTLTYPQFSDSRADSSLENDSKATKQPQSPLASDQLVPRVVLPRLSAESLPGTSELRRRASSSSETDSRARRSMTPSTSGRSASRNSQSGDLSKTRD